VGGGVIVMVWVMDLLISADLVALQACLISEQWVLSAVKPIALPEEDDVIPLAELAV
jgi:hypothetical protein